MRSCLLQLTALLVFSSSAQCARILGIFPMGTRSHYNLGSALLKGLAEKGHDVVMISPFSEKNPPKNGSYTDIELTGFVEQHTERVKSLNVFDLSKKSMFLVAPLFSYQQLKHTQMTLDHPNVQTFMQSNQKFDVVIVENFANEAHKAFAYHFNAPLIAFSPVGASSWINPLVGNPTPLAYVSETFLGYPSDMTFLQRLHNTLLHNYMMLINHLYAHPRQEKLMKKYFSEDLKLDNIIYNISLTLMNSHPSFNEPVPLVPSMIEIGGFHIKPPKKLPEDLQDYLDNSKEGVIYFSLGSHLKSALLPIEKREILLKTFSKLKQQVLWKWEEDELPGKPSNVRTTKWLPQQDILAHPNVKFFITHGGLLSTTETIYHGVPVLAIPIAGDQQLNAQKMVNHGFGLKVSLDELSEELLSKAINELLINPKYAKNAKTRSKVFHDRIVSPMDDAIYWVEYVIRHRGAPHLRVAGLDLPWYKYLLLDVILVVLVISLIVIYLTFKILKKIGCYFCKSKKIKTN